MRRILIRPQARLDLLEIWHHIALDGVDTANKVVDIRGLRDMPGKGHIRRDVMNPAFRSWSERPYVIGYRYDDHNVTLVRVVHGHRDFRRLFKGH
jgi:plasmid stabilization system protein ParE